MGALTGITGEFLTMAGAADELFDRFNPNTDSSGCSITHRKAEPWRTRMNTSKTVQHVVGTGFKAIGIVAATGVVGSHLPAAIVAYGLGSLLQAFNRVALEYPDDSLIGKKKVLGSITEAVTKQTILPF